VRVIKQAVKDMNVKSLSEMARKITQPKDRLMVLVNEAGDRANVVVASSSSYKASEVAKKLSALLGGGGHGDDRLATGGGSSRDAENILMAFEPSK
jgi:alanyl-tRNA synthetase